MRTGIRIRFEKDVNPLLIKAFNHFSKWLRRNYEFPIRVKVYVKSNYYIVNRYSKEEVSATFFAPYKKTNKPYMRIATGDFNDLEKKHGKEDAILMTLKSLAHEIQHYYQWIDETEFDEEEADNGAYEIISDYYNDSFSEFWDSIKEDKLDTTAKDCEY
ncbi:hypothetical protein [Bacillus chungangensis]|uniref:Peptidase n=1 Tax=Bacillus chungangensis TaxID=587633 RepID=A0ABT9WMT1_9BACI|nr:hypothetical protein [Bacillus chungangensis]MDQ0174595.1 hypothetical protein [Bacillus chungangensis]